MLHIVTGFGTADTADARFATGGIILPKAALSGIPSDATGDTVLVPWAQVTLVSGSEHDVNHA